MTKPDLQSAAEKKLLSYKLTLKLRWWFAPALWLAYPFCIITGRKPTRFAEWLVERAMVVKAEPVS